MQTPWEYRYAHRMQKMGSSVIREGVTRLGITLKELIKEKV